MKIKIALVSFVMLAACGGEPAKYEPTLEQAIKEKWQTYGAQCISTGQDYEACVKMCDDEIMAQGVDSTTRQQRLACHAGARKAVNQQ